MAREQHSSLAQLPKLALLQRSVKINVAQKQHPSRRRKQPRKFEYSTKLGEPVTKLKPATSAATVRTRRAYFDFKFGQLHVRTAFPTTGGFGEQVTLFCLHPARSSSRIFARFLPEIADVRSVYAPDLPGCGESDPAPNASVAAAADAISDLANDLRLRQIDVLGISDGAAVALELAAARNDIVRRVVVVGVPGVERLPRVMQQSVVMLSGRGPEQARHSIKAAVPNARFVDVADHAEDSFEANPKNLAAQIGAFLTGP
jgi:pimeloyl-ACP methyl ester carboxylesterase